MDGPSLYVGLLQVCACLQALRITTSDPLAHLRGPLAFHGLNPLNSVRNLSVEGYSVDPSRICAVFPNTNSVYLNSTPEMYSVKTIREFARCQWRGLKILILSVPCHEQADALFACEHMPSLEYLNLDSKRLVSRLIDVFDSGEFITPVNAQMVRFHRRRGFQQLTTA